MKRKYHRVGFTAAQKAELWERWRKREGLKVIGREFGKPSSCIFAHLRPTGGITPVPRRRSRVVLNGRLRHAVVIKLQRHWSPEQIAAWLKRKQIRDAVSIRQRPALVEDRAVPGHWEGDLLCGSNSSFIATLVERHSRYVMLAKVAGQHTETVVTALIQQARTLPDKLCKSLTWDRGSELAVHT